MKNIIILLCVLFIGNIYSAEYRVLPNESPDERDKLFDESQELYQKKIKYIPWEKLPELTKYMNDKNSYIRGAAYSRLYEIAMESSDRKIKEKVVEILLGALKDKENIVGTYILIRDNLSNFFSQKAKDMIIEYYKNGYEERIMMELAAAGNIREMIPLLEKLSQSKDVYCLSSDAWKAKLALARMGSKKDIDECIQILLKEYPSKEDQRINLPEIFAYIRQPETINILKEYLNDGGVTTHIPSVPYATYAIRALIDSVADVPLKETYIAFYTPQDIKTARKWMKEDYTPYKIKSASVLIEGKLVNNLNY